MCHNLGNLGASRQVAADLRNAGAVLVKRKRVRRSSGGKQEQSSCLLADLAALFPQYPYPVGAGY